MADAEHRPNRCRPISPTWPTPVLLHKQCTGLLLHFRVNGVQLTRAPSKSEFLFVSPYLTTVPSNLVIPKSDQLTPSQPWSPLWLLYNYDGRFTWANSFEAAVCLSTALDKNHPQIHYDLSRRHVGQQFHCLQGWLLQQHTGGSTDVSGISDTVSAKLRCPSHYNSRAPSRPYEESIISGDILILSLLFQTII